MLKMFLKSLLLVSLGGYIIADERDIDQEPILISTVPEDIARDVFYGYDKDMPADGRWQMSIMPTMKKGNLWIPRNISEAFHEMERALPHWYQVALRKSGGEFECFVSVNNLDLNLIVMNWLWVNWHLEEPSSKLRRILENMGAKDRDQVLFGIHDGFCYYLKYGEQKALEMLSEPANVDQDRALPPMELDGYDKQPRKQPRRKTGSDNSHNHSHSHSLGQMSEIS